MIGLDVIDEYSYLAKRMTENLTFCRAEVTKNALRGWFDKVANYLNSKELSNIAPKRIFDCDKAAFLLN